MFSTERLSLPLTASGSIAMVLGGAHAIGAVVPWTVGLPGVAALPASLAIVCLGGYAVWRDALRRLPSSVAELELDPDGTGRLRRRDGRTASVRLAGDSVVMAFGAVLRVIAEDGTSTGIVVTRDGCGDDAFRRCKVFLRWRLKAQAGPELTGNVHREFR